MMMTLGWVILEKPPVLGRQCWHPPQALWIQDWVRRIREDFTEEEAFVLGFEAGIVFHRVVKFF